MGKIRMEQNRRVNIINRLQSNIKSFSLDKDDMHKFCNLLQERSTAAGEIEMQKYNRENQTDEQYQNNLRTLRESFDLRITVNGINGEELYGPIGEVFASVNFPDNVKSLYVNSEHILRAYNYYPLNSFEVLLDFSKPEIFDFSLMPNQGTPNRANYQVQGYDATWVNGVFNEMASFIKQRSSTLSNVHNHSVYDVLLWVIGFPLAFWICYKLSSGIEKIGVDTSTFFKSAIYLYCFIASLFIFRILFHYLRWVCPLVEYRSKGSNIIANRVVLSALLIGIVGTFLTDIIKALW
jgi:hypothetical protein